MTLNNKMPNRIRALHVANGRLDPAETEVWIRVEPEQLTSATQVRGRLMGPRCIYATTVEVAYPLREGRREYEAQANPHLSLRVIIPEASFWEPESPFLYQGPVELWESGEHCDQRQISHGLRTLQLGPRGLVCNGRLLPIRGAACGACSEPDARLLRQAGCNALLVPVSTASAAIWEMADRIGFFVLGRISGGSDLAQAYALGQHACCLGWLLDQDLVFGSLVSAPWHTHPALRGQLVGVELTEQPCKPLPNGISFILCGEEVAPSLAGINLPVLIRYRHRPIEEGDADLERTPGVFGSVRQA